MCKYLNQSISLISLPGSPDTMFVGFRMACSGETDVMFFTNPINEDLQHPVQVSGITVIDSTEEAKVFIHRPDVR